MDKPACRQEFQIANFKLEKTYDKHKISNTQ